MAWIINGWQSRQTVVLVSQESKNTEKSALQLIFYKYRKATMLEIQKYSSVGLLQKSQKKLELEFQKRKKYACWLENQFCSLSQKSRESWLVKKLEKIPLDDKKTFDMLSKGIGSGVKAMTGSILHPILIHYRKMQVAKWGTPTSMISFVLFFTVWTSWIQHLPSFKMSRSSYY